MTASAQASAVDEEAASPALAPPPSNPHFPLCDSIRGIGVTAIIVYHVAQFSGAMFTSSWGRFVDTFFLFFYSFFALSAFLLYRPFVVDRARGRKSRFGAYFKRRVLRIIPGYWFALTALAIWPGITGVFTGDWYVYYFFLQSYSPDTFGLGIAVAWSLCVEVAFYLTLPILATLLRRLSLGKGEYAWMRGELAAIALLGAAGYAVRVAAAEGWIPKLMATNLPGMFTWFALGMACAVISVATENKASRFVDFVAKRPGLLWGAAFAFYVAISLYVSAPHVTTFQADLAGPIAAPPIFDVARRETILTFLALGFNICFVLPAFFGDRAGGLPRKVLAFPPLVFAGVVSYSTYLWHYEIGLIICTPANVVLFPHAGPLGLVEHLPGGTGTPILAIITLTISLAVGTACYYLVELPFLKRKETSLFAKVKS